MVPSDAVEEGGTGIKRVVRGASDWVAHIVHVTTLNTSYAQGTSYPYSFGCPLDRKISHLRRTQL